MADLYAIAFTIFAIITLGSSLLIFLSKRLMHAVLGLTGAFIGSALIFLMFGQDMIALLQLFVLVGGLSTYLIVAIASEDKGKHFIKLKYFFPVVIVVSVLLYYLTSKAVVSPVYGASSFTTTFFTAFPQYFAIFFVVVLLLFASAIGSVLFLKKFAKVVT